jgi:hypothetical protein
MKNLKQNKRGWIKIVEAFVAILLIAGVVLAILNKGYTERKDYSEEIYEIERSILFQIQTDDALRDKVVGVGTLPIEWDDVNFPLEIKTVINTQIPTYLECEARICELNDDCGFRTMNKDVYAQSVAITGTQTAYKPRQLKIFCWMKG